MFRFNEKTRQITIWQVGAEGLHAGNHVTLEWNDAMTLGQFLLEVAAQHIAAQVTPAIKEACDGIVFKEGPEKT